MTKHIKKVWQIFGAILLTIILSFLAQINIERARTDPNISISLETKDQQILITAQNPNIKLQKANFYLDNKLFFQAYKSPIATNSSKLPRGIVTFTIDDGWLDAFDNGFLIFEKYNYPATVAVIKNYVDRPGSLSKRQLEYMVKHGWSISSHSISDDPITDLTPDEWEPVLVDSKVYLWQNLWGTTTLIYPSGATNERIAELTRKHYMAARIYDDGDNTLPIDRYQIKIHSLDVESDLDDFKMWIKSAQNQKHWVVFALHHISDANTGFYTITPEFLDEALKIVSQNDVEVLNLDQALQVVEPELSAIKENQASWQIEKGLLKAGKHEVKVEIDGKLSRKVEFYI